MTPTEEFNSLAEAMHLPANILNVVLQCPRSTVFNYMKGVSTPPATALSMMRFLRYIYESDREKYIDWLLLTEFEAVTAGTQNPSVANAFRQGKIRPALKKYIEDIRS